MNIRISLLALLTTIPAILYSQDKKILTDSKIERVIVFLQGAQIERVATVAIPAGSSIIEFRGLSPDIEEQSIQVKGVGNFTVLSVNRQNNFLNEQKYNEVIKNLESKITDVKDQIEKEGLDIQVLQKEQEILAANQSIGNGGAGLDLNKLKLAIEFQKQRLTESKAKQLKIQKSINLLNVQYSALQRQLSELRTKAVSNTSDIAVKVDSKGASRGDFTISYLVKNASWYPSYDLRATEVNKPIELIYRANISQQSGEEWNNVKLVLSSGDPSRGGNKPVLKPYQIGYNVLYQEPGSAVTSVQGVVRDATNGGSMPGVSVRVKGTSIATTTSEQGSYSIQIPSPGSVLLYTMIGFETIERTVSSNQMNVSLRPATQALNEVVSTAYSNEVMAKVASVSLRGNASAPGTIPLQVEVLEGQTTVQFDVAQPYSIASDGKQLTVELSSNNLTADYKYNAVPKISQDAYLTAAITDISDLNLMSGEANIFFGGAFLGKTLINVQNVSDTLLISLGVDKNLIVKRTRQKEENDKSFTGATKRATRSFLYTVMNRKTVPITISIEDQIPVSNSSEVTVEKQEVSNAKIDEITGRLTWEIQLQPNEKKEFQMRYMVKYPRNKPVRLE